MTRVVCDVGQPRRMETCGAEEPYEGNLHVRFCGGIGRAIANPTRTDTWLLEDPERPTTEKIRLVAGRQQLLRFDHESQAPQATP